METSLLHTLLGGTGDLSLDPEAQQAQQLQSAKFGGFPAPKLPINMASGASPRFHPDVSKQKGW